MIDMSEERFMIKESTMIDGYCIFDSEKEYAFVPVDKKAQLEPTVKVLNTLYNENQKLGKSYDITEQVNNALSEENEDLHRIQEDLVDENRLLRKEYITLLDLVLDSGIDYCVCDELEDIDGY